MLANAAPPRQSAPAALLDGARAGGAPSGASAATSAPQSAPAALLDGARAGGVPSAAPAATSAPQSAPAALLDGARAGGAPSGAPAATSAPKFASGALVDGSDAGAGVPGSPVATSAPERALGVSSWRRTERRVRWSSGRGLGGWLLCTCRRAGLAGRHCGAGAGTRRVPLTADRAAPQLEQRRTGPCEPVHSRHQSPPRRYIPAAVRRHVWLRDGGCCCYRDPLSGRRCTSSHLLQIDHLLPVAQGGGPEPSNLNL